MCFTLLMSLMSLHVAHVNVLSLKSLTYLLNECWGEYSYPVCVWERERENMCVSNSDTLCSISEWIDVSFDSFWFVVWLIQRVPWLNLLIRWVASLDNVWCDSLCDMCGVTHYVTCVNHYVTCQVLHLTCVVWLMCAVTHVWCDSCVLWLMCAVTHVWCDSFKEYHRCDWFKEYRDLTCSHSRRPIILRTIMHHAQVSRDFYICVTWLLEIW